MRRLAREASARAVNPFGSVLRSVAHGDRAAFEHDVRRCTMMVAEGWLVVRFTWHEVMHDRAYVRRVLEAVVARREDHAAGA